MYEIKIKVRGNGTLETATPIRLFLGTLEEVARAKLVFDIDDSIEGTYQYLKFLNGKTSCFYRIYNQEFILTKSIHSIPGVWLMSFISTNKPIENETISGSYAYISKPIEASVAEGIFTKGSKSDEAYALNQICSMEFTELVIPDAVETIGDYFLYNSRKTFSLKIGPNVTSIGAYSFYDANITKLEFASDSLLRTLKDNSLYHINLSGDVVIPRSITSWGKYIFQSTSGNKLSFEDNCSLESLGSYALWENGFKEINLPDRLKTLSGNTYVIKNCANLSKLKIPKSITTIIPANAIFGCDKLTDIVLEEGFNVSANFSNCTKLTHDSIVNMLYALKNLNGTSSKSLTIGSTNLSKLNETEIQIATNKNWTLS